MIELLWNDPIGEDRMAKYLDVPGMRDTDRVLDIGCGCGEVLIRLHERYGIHGVGIDSSAPHVEEAERRSAGRVVDSRVRFEVADAERYEVEPNSFDLAICLGATHALGLGADAYANALRRMLPMVVPGGSVLVAEGYAMQPADPEYRRRFLGETTPDSQTHAANVATGVDLGFVPLSAWTSTPEEWDDFEWTYQQVVERHALERPDDADVQLRLEQRREWMEGYLGWGRETLGYGVYWFRRPHV